MLSIQSSRISSVRFQLSYLLVGVAFELDASCSFINASCVISLDIEVEPFRKKKTRI